MAIRLDVLKGPVGQKELEGIARTYGNFSRRFQSPAFCRTVFNDNPYGYSYHAFAYDGERIIGHYSLVPQELRDRGKRFLSMRGEGLFLDEAYRSRVVEVDGKRLPCGIALMTTLYDRALAESVELIQIRTPPEIGLMLERLMGFSSVTVPVAQLRYRVSQARPEDELHHVAEKRLKRALRAAALSGFILSQRIRRRLLGGLLVLAAAPKVQVNAAEPLEGQLALLAKADRDESVNWSVSRDVESLRWQLKLGRLEIYSLEAAPERFAAVMRMVSPQMVSVFQLLAWNLEPTDWRAGLAVLNAILKRSEQEAVVSFVADRDTVMRYRGALGLGMRLVGSTRLEGEFTLYFKSKDERFRSGDGPAYDCLFAL